MEKGNENMKIEYVPTDKQKSYNMQVKGILGIGIEAFINDLKRNEGGKFDSLYTNV